VFCFRTRCALFHEFTRPVNEEKAERRVEDKRVVLRTERALCSEFAESVKGMERQDRKRRRRIRQRGEETSQLLCRSPLVEVLPCNERSAPRGRGRRCRCTVEGGRRERRGRRARWNADKCILRRDGGG